MFLIKNKQLFEIKGIYFTAVVTLLAAIIFSLCFSASVGQADVPLKQTFNILVNKITGGAFGSLENIPKAFVNIVWQVRIPRILFAVFIGTALAVSGAVMQALVQNPLADPYILGISSGSSLGATFAILIGFGGGTIFSQFGLTFGAFLGAVLASMAVLLLSSVGGRMTSMKLVLSGSVISALFSSFSSIIVYFSNNAEGMKNVTFWAMGSLASSGWSKIPVLALVVSIVTVFFLFQHRILNTMLLGDEAATTLGIPLSKYRRFYMLLTSLLTGVVVAYSGMIGFIGLIIPHIVRGFIGSDHKRMLPMTALIGSLFLIWADVFSRIIVENVELPIGIITSIIGAPMFIYIIVKKGYNFGG
ncbi:iron ABC transporter permease [Clostridium sp. BNL1100]|uniref:FecCD family ABC transporter permease n=1 Tax=Clostridium sp. BNL1100 TaxID=755731 RepID=UPI001FA71813|nr:iron ABC transporter permease [Clostridium sp. BNL1100]